MFDDAVFMGDSRTRGLIIYNELDNVRDYSSEGLNVSRVLNPKSTDPPSLAEMQKDPSFQKVYIAFGINELTWPNSGVFFQRYKEIIDRIRAIQPNATIYVQSILPVTKKRSEKGDYFNNPRIKEYNEKLQQMAQEKQVKYLNVAEIMMTKDGALPDEASSDGIHLNRTYCAKWLDYLRSHTT